MGNHLGSTTFLTDEKGQPRQYLLYLPFAETLLDQKAGGYDARYKYTGKETDEHTGLNYHGARYYNPNISMWYGVDPLIDMYPGHSPFNYVMGNPIRLIDPTGMSSENRDEGNPTYCGGNLPEILITAKNGQYKMQQDGLKPLASLNVHSVVMESRSRNKSDYPVTINNPIFTRHLTYRELYNGASGNLAINLLQGKYGMNHAVGYMQHSVFSAQTDFANIVTPIITSFGPMPFLSIFGSGLRYSSWAAKGVTNLSTSSLNPTHYITKSKTAMQTLMNDIRVNGIQESIKYVEHNGVKYIVAGHHRFYAAQRLGIQNVPVQQVQLPYGGYKGVMDLMMEPGKQPGFWKFMK